MRPAAFTALIIATALFMENMDSTVIATSLPAIAADIGTSPLTLKLAITSYLLSLAVFIPASGWTADRFGARRIFILALLVFTVSSVLCGMAESFGMLVATRALQGLGGAMMTASRFADSRGVFAGIVEIAIVGYVLIKLMSMARRRLLIWHQEANEPTTA